MSEEKSWVEVACPFCKEGGFDLYGLQLHLERGRCTIFGWVEEGNTVIEHEPV